MLKFISRILVGLLFIFSGFVKAVDPVGGAIKFTDYFEAFGMEFLTGIALPLAILLSTLEFIVGFHLLLGIRMKITALVTFYLMSFFTVLTFILAIFNPVSDCGCFGDAIKLTNWDTFFKNLVTMPFAWILFRDRKQFEDKILTARLNILTLFSVVMAIGISIYSYRHLPVLDFRPFKTGVNIPEAMKIPKDAPQPEYKTTFILEKEGERKEFDENNYPYEDTTWVFIDRKTILIKEGATPEIKDFFISNKQGEEVTQKLLSSKTPEFLMIAPDISKINGKELTGLKKISDRCRNKDIRFYCITSSLYDEILKFEMEYEPMFNYIYADKVLLQSIIRGNPGLVVLDKGTILDKYNYVDTPAPEIVDNTVSYILRERSKQKERYIVLIFTLLIISSVLIIYKKQ